MVMGGSGSRRWGLKGGGLRLERRFYRNFFSRWRFSDDQNCMTCFYFVMVITVVLWCCGNILVVVIK